MPVSKMSPKLLARRTMGRLHPEARAQDSLETLLVTGVVVVIMLTFLLLGLKLLVPEVVGNSCHSIDTGFPVTTPTPSSPGACVN